MESKVCLTNPEQEPGPIRLRSRAISRANVTSEKQEKPARTSAEPGDPPTSAHSAWCLAAVLLPVLSHLASGERLTALVCSHQCHQREPKLQKSHFLRKNVLPFFFCHFKVELNQSWQPRSKVGSYLNMFFNFFNFAGSFVVGVCCNLTSA